MKSNIKKRLIHSVSIYLMILLIFMSISTGQAAVSASRTIESVTLTAGNSTNVTVVITNDATARALSLKETIPSGWSITKISDDADQFKASTNEWVWLTVAGSAVKTVKYKITVPVGTASGVYNVDGTVVSSASTITVAGSKTINVVGVTVGDTIAPTTTISGVVEGGKYNDNVTITLTATDNAGGSGVNKTMSIINAGTASTYTAAFIVDAEGLNNIKYWSVDKAGNVENAKSVNFTINKTIPPVTGTFGFIVTPSSATVNAGENAQYNLTISNTGSIADTYSLNVSKPNGTSVTLSKTSVLVGPGNSSIIGLNVSSSTVGIYIVSVTAKSKADANNSATVSTTTNIVVPVLDIQNLRSVPSTAISKTNPAHISADVIKGMSNIVSVAFGVVDVNNLLGKGTNTILAVDENVSGAQGLYVPEQWYGNYASIGNIAVSGNVAVSGRVVVSDIVTILRESDSPGYIKVGGTFKANNASNGTDALLWFSLSTGSLSDVTNFSSGAKLNIQNANSTFQAKIAKLVSDNVTFEYSSSNVFTLYNVTGSSNASNPRIIPGTVPSGRYRIYAAARDASDIVLKFIDVDTIPPSTSRNSGGGGGGDGTYPTFTATPTKTVNATPGATVTVTPSITIVEPAADKPVEQVQETPTDMTKKGSPGFGIVVAIGIFATIYILRRRK